MYSAVLKLMHQQHTWTDIMVKKHHIDIVLIAIQISFRLDVVCYSCKVSVF